MFKDNDYHESGVSMMTIFGGNGDYYISIWKKDDLSRAIRIPMSGGQATTRLKLAVAELHWAMEEGGFNKFPEDED